MQTKTLRLVVMTFILTMLGLMPRMVHAQVDKGKAKIAEEAFIYGFPMVMNKRGVLRLLRRQVLAGIQGSAQSAL